MADESVPEPAAVPEPAVNYANFSNDIYLNGLLTEQTPALTTDLTALPDTARARMSPAAYGYVAGGAGSGRTMSANLESFERRRIVPRMLRDVGTRSLARTVLGTPMPAPVLLAPIGVQSIIHPQGELAVARAAAELGVPVVHSTASSYAMEEVAEAAGDGPRWYQLYWPKDDDVCVSLLERAARAGYTTLVVTLDTWLLGWRPTDLDRAYLPFLQRIGIANYLSDPAFRAGLAKPVEEAPLDAVVHWAGMFADPTKTWQRLSFLRDHWSGPIVLKGIQHPDDARRARDSGMDGVVVSNHGGRQLDGAIGSLEALAPVVEAVGDETSVLFDSGVRTGSDVLKALALGAEAVLLGRPYVYGLGAGGQAGVSHVLRCLLAELDLSLALSGHRDVSELAPELLSGP
ncbi:lactate 2-monooxygenase [Streptomyces sp. XM4193]|uniref:lactate 2-monooxygenase n=1 Tax=Streptomyces sp. XM4193 TaxID=2929782 RepID=UPI001FFA5365|nr:lactate 2-monooxygenase [Streptomyces sp. XM4193]MCK1798438.1 lactate 2-monooxygenase [Streptomyces sp. XM4193]